MKQTIFASAAIAAAVVAAACGGSSPYSSTSGTATAPPAATPVTAPSSPPGVTTVGVATSKLGQILVDGSGRTLYLFEGDKGTTSACYDACANAWPPVLTTGMPLARMGVNGSLLGTTTRKDGTMEIEYNGHPLYYFIADKQAGDTAGQGINNFGAPWYVLSPAGTKVDNG